MKIARFSYEGSFRLGLVEGEVVSECAEYADIDLTKLLSGGTDAMHRLYEAGMRADAPRHALADLRLEAPLRPGKLLGLGANYPRPGPGKVHGVDIDALRDRGEQYWFDKATNCVVGPEAAIMLPPGGEQVIPEVELGVVIGSTCRHVSADRAMAHVAGYVVVNDVTVVDWLLANPSLSLGKSYQGHGPIGPWLVTPDEVARPYDLDLHCTVNGETVQRGNTGAMLTRIPDMIAFLSSRMTLEPGEILATGSPERSEICLRPGDEVACIIEGIGALVNMVCRSE